MAVWVLFLGELAVRLPEEEIEALELVWGEIEACTAELHRMWELA